MQKVTHLIDIEAPCEEVFNTVIDIEKRMQLSPLWGVSRLQEVSPDYPQADSSYRIRVMTDAPYGISQGTLNASQSALAGLAQVLLVKLAAAGEQPVFNGTQEQSATARTNQPTDVSTLQEYFVADYQPPSLFRYHLDYDCKTIVTWQFQSIHLGTRINYEEAFCDERILDEKFIPTVHRVVQEWLTNIKHYCELRDKRSRLFIKWFLDRYYLRLRPDQRRVVLLMLVMQAIGLGMFMIAVIVWGIARLFL